MRARDKQRQGITRKNFLETSGALVLGLTARGASAAAAQAGAPSGTAGSAGSGLLDFKIHRLNLKHTWTISRNSSDYKDNVFVRFQRDGITGWGEAAPNVRYGESAEKTLDRLEAARRAVESADWLHYADLKTTVDRAITDQSCAKAAFDIGLLDWVGKKFGQPLFRLFGLDPARTPITTFSIGIDTPDVIKQKVEEASEFPILKIKVGRENDAEILAAVRSVTKKPLRVDANEGWKTKEQALEKIKWLEDQGVEFIEQPLPSTMLEETAWLRERVNMPIIADESVKSAADIPKLAASFDGINIKLMKSGGIQEALTMIKMARALGMKTMLGCMIESSVAIAAAAHLSPLVDYADLDGNLLISNDPFRGTQVEKGKLILPDRPGLGVEIVPDRSRSRGLRTGSTVRRVAANASRTVAQSAAVSPTPRRPLGATSRRRSPKSDEFGLSLSDRTKDRYRAQRLPNGSIFSHLLSCQLSVLSSQFSPGWTHRKLAKRFRPG